MRVLVVDDSTPSYMGLEEMLKTWSADVTVLNRGRMLPERLRSAALRDQPYDVVLLDHGLPDASSAELLREIRMDPAVGGTYIVLLTALAFDPTYEGTKAIEPDTCIAKPVRQESLKGALRASRAPRTRTPGVAATATAIAADGATPTLGLGVLVVDDNAVNREVAVAMLEESNCRVTVAHDGQSAVLAARDHRFDVILMDCQMPGMDGFAATAAIRRTEAEQGVPPTQIIALTANVLTRDRERCLEAGMNSFLGKPFTATQLIGALLPIAQACGTLQAREVAKPAVQPEAARQRPMSLPTHRSRPNFSTRPSPTCWQRRFSHRHRNRHRRCSTASRSRPSAASESRWCSNGCASCCSRMPRRPCRASRRGWRRATSRRWPQRRTRSNRRQAIWADAVSPINWIVANRWRAREPTSRQFERPLSGLQQSYAAFEAALRELTGRRTGT